jgi:DNA-binding HxlR family transcriptional regulator
MTRSYDQYCPLARALDVVGDRWTMLVMRELFLAPKRFTDLQQRLEGIAPNLLSRRLKDLESAGLIRRRRLDPPAASTVYELTEKAVGLEAAMLDLAKWGVQFLGSYEGDEAFELEWLLQLRR